MTFTFAVEFFREGKKIASTFVNARSEIDALETVANEGRVPPETYSVEVTKL